MADFELIPIEKPVDNSSFEIIPVKDERHPLDKMTTGEKVLQAPRALAETSAALLTGIAGALGGAAAGVPAALVGDYPTAKHVEEEVAKALTFQPVTPMGQVLTEKISPFVSAPAEIGREMVNLPMESYNLQGLPRFVGEKAGEFTPYGFVGKGPRKLAEIDLARGTKATAAAPIEAPAKTKTFRSKRLEKSRQLLQEGAETKQPEMVVEEVIPVKEPVVKPVEGQPAEAIKPAETVGTPRPPEIVEPGATSAPRPLQELGVELRGEYKDGELSVEAIDKSGKVVGNAAAGEYWPGVFVPDSVGVDAPYRRKGLASAMYDAMKDFAPEGSRIDYRNADIFTDEGALFKKAYDKKRGYSGDVLTHEMTAGDYAPSERDIVYAQTPTSKVVAGKVEPGLVAKEPWQMTREELETEYGRLSSKTSDEAQGKVDDKIDELMSRGLSFEEASEHPDTARLFRERDIIDNKDFRAAYDDIKERVNSVAPDVNADEILRSVYSVDPGSQTSVYMASKYTQDAVRDQRGSGEKIVRYLTSEYGLQHNLDMDLVLNPNVSGWGQPKIDTFKREIVEKAKTIVDAVNSYFNRDTRWADNIQTQKALSSGKPVPAEVLADYPDLLPSKGKIVEPVAKEPWQMTRETVQIPLGKSSGVTPTEPVEAPIVSGSIVTYRGRERVVESINEDGTYNLVGHQKPVNGKYVKATGRPSVDVAEISGVEFKLNKAGYTPQEIRKMSVEDKLETIRKIKENEAVPPDPAILEKQKAVHERIQNDARLKNIADIEVLKKAGYTEDRITTMTDRWIRETAAEVRGERQNAIADIELKLDEFDTIMRELGGKDVRELTDAELDRVTKALADAEPYASEVIEAQRTAYEEAVRQGEEGLTEQDLLDIDLIRKEIAEDQAIRAADDQTITKSIERELSALEAAEKPIDFIKRRQLIEKAVKKAKASQQESMIAEKKGQVTRLKEFTEEMYRATLDEQEAMPQRGRPRRATAEAEDWEARLAEEGMPAELDFMKDFESERQMAGFAGRISKKLDIVSEALDRMIRGEQMSDRAIEGLVKQGIPRDWATDTVQHFVNQRKAFMDAYNTVYSNIPINYIKDARVTLSNAYKWLPERFSDRVIDKDSFINFLKTTEYKTNHPERMHRYGSDPKGAVDQLELFGKVSPDEAAFMRSLIDALGKKANFDLVVADVKNANGYYSFAKNLMVVKEPRVVLHEVGHFTFYNMMSGAERVKFAESVIRQFYKDGKLDREALRTHLGNQNFFESMNLSEIFATEFSNFLAGKTFLKEHASMYERVKAFLSKFLYNLTQAKAVPADRLALYENILREANKGPEPVRTRPRAQGSRSIGLFNRGDVIERMPHQVDMMRETGPTFDMLGLQQTYEWMKSVYDRLKRDSNMPGNKIIAEVTGSDPANPHYVRQVEAAADKWLVQQWVQMSSAWAKGTPVEGIEFKAFKADTSAGFFHNNNLTTLGEIERFLKKNKVSNETLTNILRGDKSPATAAETQAVGRVRDWLDFMRDRYKDFLRQEYVRWLPKKEAAALNDIIKGVDIAATVQKYKIGSVEVLVDIAKRYKELENWGLDDYLPKVELGSYRIDIKLKDEKGKSYSKTIAVALSQKDAVRKITDWVNENPDYVGDFTIDTSHRGVLNDITSVTTRKQYYSIVNKLGKAIEREVEGLEKGMAAQLAKGVVSKKFAIRPTDKFSEFTLPRRDVLKGEKDIFPVLRKYSRVMEKKMALDPVIHEFKQMKDKLPPNLRDMTENMLEDTKGTYWYADKLADQVIGAVHKRLEAKGFDVGPPPVMSVSRPLAKLRGLQANVKLGYRPINAFVNWASGQGHVWTKVGEKAIYEANALRNTPEGRALLDELGPYMGMSFAEESVGKFTPRTEWWKPLGMFQKAEAPNREVAMLANYLVAREQGLSVEAAKDAAIKGNRFQNFVYNISSLPRSMRGPIGKTLLQFKPYLVQEMHFIASLRGPELFRYLTMQLALGGPRGAIMVMKSLPILGGIAAWDEMERWLNTNYPRASRGVAGAAGLDMSAMATFQFPKSLSDWGGPTMSDMLNFYDQIVVPVQEGSMRYEPEMLAGKAKTLGEKNIPFLRHWFRVWDNVVTGDGYVRDEEGKIRTEAPLYDPRDSIAKRYMAKGGYAARRLAGAETIQESASKVEERIDEREEAILNKQKEAIGGEISKRLSRGEDVPQSLWDAMAELGVKGDAIRARTADRMLTPLQRRLRRRDQAGKLDVLEHEVQFD